jgi:hypothetical protein
MDVVRLNRLVNILEGVQRANKPFNLGFWIENATSDEEGSGFNKTVSGNVAETCGTACCAFGYAALDPEFQAAGLKMEAIYLTKEQVESDDWDNIRPQKRPITNIADYNALMQECYNDDIDVDIRFGDERFFDAAADFFGITENAAQYLFMPAAYANGNNRPVLPSEVIARVNTVIAMGGKCPNDLDD